VVSRGGRQATEQMRLASRRWLRVVAVTPRQAGRRAPCSLVCSSGLRAAVFSRCMTCWCQLSLFLQHTRCSTR
jgi:hypothetical protein